MALGALFACLALAVAHASAIVLHTSSRWILDSNNQRVKLRCVNWAGHMEVGIPEGLQFQTPETIANWIASNGFNCVRLTFSIDRALNPTRLVRDSFTAAAGPAGVSASTMQSLYNTVVAKNSWISSATLEQAYARVIDALGARGVLVMLDNHNSRAGWCCSTSDGNGWWASASGYNAANSQYFDVNNWLNGLRAMATLAKSHSNVVGLALRNELRAVGSQDGNNHADWYNFVGQGLNAVHSANADLLIVVGGVSYATDFSFLGSNPLNRTAFGNKVVYEFHNYQWTFSTNDCNRHKSLLGQRAGYLLTQNQAYTGPLWLSEFGWAQSNPSADENAYASCLVSYMQSNDAEWAYWALMGSYYVRSQSVNFDEGFGLLNHDWSGWRNGSFLNTIGKMMQVTQGP
ncbi:glycosyl hydrolase family 5 protein/cellulase [Auricularia subglabra TFB-10046 SS5]|uniref:Glycosyl hydrolase family 5 protein/cellulase n=1 Tax=Auricularia subglabra (strain TFB-10046 / SS5) TaxID=717982 RepID=J0WRJ2_AURST|nr:glycosyl hydrolase family 5 protein/cellulase [Auricularia subglabra TFB-10046 SS5]